MTLIACSANANAPKPKAENNSPPPSTSVVVAPKTEAVPEYVLANPSEKGVGSAILLENNKWGVMMEGLRIVASETGTSIAREVGDSPLHRVEKLPGRLGGGFLFESANSLYASQTFDGPLRAITSFEGSIALIAFGTDGILVRGYNGERWLIDAKTGNRKTPNPIAVRDIAALDDGRALAVAEPGIPFVSLDSGKTWKDVGSDLRGYPGRVVAQEGELWLEDNGTTNSRALRMAQNGTFSDFGAIPNPKSPPKRDARFKNNETPLSAALHVGERIGPWTGVVGASGDVIKIDLRSGAVSQTISGILPQNMACEALAVMDDVLLVCSERGKTSVVVSGVLMGKVPKVERSFPADGPFFAGQDGTLVFFGPCDLKNNEGLSAEKAARLACARNAEGQWEPFVQSAELTPQTPHSSTSQPTGTASSSSARGGPPSAQTSPQTNPKSPPNSSSNSVPRLVRWIPRPGRPPIAIVVTDNEIGTLDIGLREERKWQLSNQPRDITEALKRQIEPMKQADRAIIDKRWTATQQGELRTLLDDGKGIEISADGAITVWPFTFEKVAVSGARAFARNSNGQAFQTVDYGRTWAEVLAPPTRQRRTFDPRACSALGCDLAGWLRIGWETSAPAPPDERVVVRAGPRPDLPKVLSISCSAVGNSESKFLPQTDSSPDNFGLGAQVIPVTSDVVPAWSKMTFGRGPTNPAVGSPQTDVLSAPRALFHGPLFVVESSDKPDRPFGEIAVVGAVQNRQNFKKELLFVEPLVPNAPIRRVSMTLDMIGKTAKNAGMSIEQFVANEKLDPVALVPITPMRATKQKPTASGDVFLSFAGEGTGTLHIAAIGGTSPKAELFFFHRGGMAQSVAATSDKEFVALLGNDDSEDEVIVRFSPSGVTELGRLPPPPTSLMSPANPDVVAIGPKGEVGVIRTVSGSEPPTAEDPALLILPGQKVIPLAPWSTAVSADSPECETDTTSYRTTLQTIAAWARIVGYPVSSDPYLGMTARVRWSPERVCIESIEVPESRSIDSFNNSVPTIVTAAFGPNQAARSTIQLGAESRTTLSCALSPH